MDPLDLTDRELARFTAKVVVQPNGCWQWTGAKNSNGYPCLCLRKKGWLAHRLMFLLTHGYLTPSLQVDHTCHEENDYECIGGRTCLHRLCVNPAHLEEVTGAENNRRKGTWRLYNKKWFARRAAERAAKAA